MSKNPPFQAYPHLTPDEFAAVAQHFADRYRQAALTPTQWRQWALRVCTALNTAPFSPDGPEYTTYLQIVRSLDAAGADDDRGLAAGLDGFSFDAGEVVEGDREMVDAEEADAEQVNYEERDDLVVGRGHVRYEIHLHPTYRVPCLWFSLHDLPADEQALNVDTVFRRLVPDQYKDGLRGSVGGIGGISVDVCFLSLSLLSLPLPELCELERAVGQH